MAARAWSVSPRLRWGMLAAAAALVGGTAVVGAQSVGEVRACVDPKGSIVIVGTGVPCAKGDQALTWNIQGPAGPAGPAGPQGSPGVSGYEVVAVQQMNTSNTLTVQASCPAGKRVLGGGAEVLGSITVGTSVLRQSGPTPDNAGWKAFFVDFNAEPNTFGLKVSAICATVQT